ncbi:MAG: folylpolyglutamate synthase/dihydrofolate synthase family protein [Acidimicrobiia bacterium]|nr:MAG: folylpolyglutamate synthase/dihydrofolate synthase family protein [Acidimicrobiia bacterium]
MTDTTAPQIRNREDAEDFLNERIGRGVQPGLDRITGLLAFMDDPQLAYPSIHIAGTNGKTTVSRMVQQILGSHGLATGGFTSPHLDRVEERFSIHGVSLDPHDFTDAVRDIAWFVMGYEASSGELVTYFEVTAALAFSIFATATVDVAVVEVGLGGRLDATNVIDAAVSVVTGIDIDHTEYLGDTIELIAAEKVAILKQEGTLVTGPLPDEALDVVSRRVAETNANWVKSDEAFSVLDATIGVGGWQVSVNGVFGEYHDLFLPLHGRHQVEHLATSVATAEMLLGRALDNDLLQIAVAATTAPGRLEVVSRHPLVIFDGAHNHQGFEGLAATLDSEFPPTLWNLVLGVRGERSTEALVQPLKGLVGHVFACAAVDTSSVPPDDVAAGAESALGVSATTYPDVAAALSAAEIAAGSDGGVVVAGSLYVVGEARGTLVPSDDRSSEAHLRFDSSIEDDEEQDTDFDRFDDDSDE